MTVPARDVMLRIERPIERPEAADEEESPCPPPERELLLSMFRVLKDLHLYCEESGRGELSTDASPPPPLAATSARARAAARAAAARRGGGRAAASRAR